MTARAFHNGLGGLGAVNQDARTGECCQTDQAPGSEGLGEGGTTRKAEATGPGALVHDTAPAERGVFGVQGERHPQRRAVLQCVAEQVGVGDG